MTQLVILLVIIQVYIVACTYDILCTLLDADTSALQNCSDYKVLWHKSVCMRIALSLMLRVHLRAIYM